MASEFRNIRTHCRRGVRFGPGQPRDTLAKSRKGPLSALASSKGRLFIARPYPTSSFDLALSKAGRIGSLLKDFQENRNFILSEK